MTGWVRLGEASLGRDLPSGQVASINLDEVSEQVDGQVLGAYLELQQESPEASAPSRSRCRTPTPGRTWPTPSSGGS